MNTTVQELPLRSDQLTPADRSILEAASQCPRQAAFLESGQILIENYAMASGNGVHTAISETITEHIESQGGLSNSEIADYLTSRLAASRTDIQPDVMHGCSKGFGWALGAYLNGMHHEDIKAYDGGRGELSSQYAYPLDEFGLLITSELDLVHAGRAPDLISVIDWKTGQQRWDHHDVADAFQFRMHAALVLKKFPDAQGVEISVWNTRTNQQTYPVLFKRENLYAIEYRIRNAAAQYYKTRGKAPNDAEPWPLVEKCSACPAARLCDASGMPTETPEQIVDALALLAGKVTALEKAAKAEVKRLGRDVETPLGNFYGANKPRAARAPTMSVYQIKSKKEETTEAGEPE